jgi:hypothetical protein
MTTIDIDSSQAPMPEPDPNAVSITINGRTVAAQKGEYIIAAADRVDEYIPRFCYHPRMSSVGMCRQCLVEVEGPRGPMMVVSCMTPVSEGQIVRTDTDQVKPLVMEQARVASLKRSVTTKSPSPLATLCSWIVNAAFCATAVHVLPMKLRAMP